MDGGKGDCGVLVEAGGSVWGPDKKDGDRYVTGNGEGPAVLSTPSGPETRMGDTEPSSASFLVAAILLASWAGSSAGAWLDAGTPSSAGFPSTAAEPPEVDAGPDESAERRYSGLMSSRSRAATSSDISAAAWLSRRIGAGGGAGSSGWSSSDISGAMLRLETKRMEDQSIFIGRHVCGRPPRLRRRPRVGVDPARSVER